MYLRLLGHKRALTNSYLLNEQGVFKTNLQSLTLLPLKGGSMYLPLNWGQQYKWVEGFPGSSTGKESTCNAGDPGSIPEAGRSPGEGIGNPLQYSWASPVAHMVKNPPAMWEIWVQSLGREDPLEEGMATHSIVLGWRIPWTEKPGGLQSRGSQRGRHDWATKHSTGKVEKVMPCNFSDEIIQRKEH